MYKYVRIPLIILIYILFISFVVNAEDIDKYTKNANIIYSTQKVEDKTQKKQQLPENAQKWTKMQVYNYIMSHFYWSSWTWVSIGDYYSVSTVPFTYIDNMLFNINYDKTILIHAKSPLDIQKMLYERMSKDLELTLKYNEYMVNFNDKKELICFGVE